MSHGSVLSVTRAAGIPPMVTVGGAAHDRQRHGRMRKRGRHQRRRMHRRVAVRSVLQDVVADAGGRLAHGRVLRKQVDECCRRPYRARAAPARRRYESLKGIAHGVLLPTLTPLVGLLPSLNVSASRRRCPGRTSRCGCRPGSICAGCRRCRGCRSPAGSLCRCRDCN